MTGRPARPKGAPAPRMSDAQHAAIVLELVRLTLGGKPRGLPLLQNPQPTQEMRP